MYEPELNDPEFYEKEDEEDKLPDEFDTLEEKYGLT